MKKLLFLLLGLAIATNASARADLKQHSLKQLPKTTMTKQVKASKVSATTISGLKSSVTQTQKLQPTTTADIWNAKIQNSKFKAPNKRIVPKSNIKAIISEQPEGEVKHYTRGGTALWYDDGIAVGNQTGTTDIVYAADGETVYIKNMIYTCGDQYGDSWMEGTIQGNEIHVPLGQSIYYSSSWGADIVAVWGTTYVADGYVEFTPDETVTEAVYLIDGDVISLQNTVPGTGEYAAYEGTGLSAYWSDDATWDYVMEWNTTYTYTEGVAPTIYTDEDIVAMYQNGGYLLGYNRVGEAIVYYSSSLYLDIQSGVTLVYIADDFSAVYLRDPVYDVEVGSWVVGEFSDDGESIIVPLDQYIYWDSDNLAGIKLGWGTFVQNEGFTADATVTEAVYAFNWDDLSLTLQNTSSVGTVADEDLSEATGLALVGDAGDFAGWLNWNTAYYVLPEDPEDLAVEPAARTADVTWTDDYDSQWNLRYRPYVEARKYFWDFEEEMASDRSLPGGWTTIDNDGDGNVWYHLNTAPSTGATWYCHSGYGHVTSASYNGSALSPDNWLVSPLVNLCGEVSFWAAGQDPSWASEKFAVYVTTGDPTDVSSYVKISDDETAVGEVTYYHYDLSAYDGQRGYVAIRHYNVSDMFRLNVDDITIGDPDAEIVEIPDWIYVYDLDETEYTIEGLTPETEYEVQVQSFNAGGASDWTTSVNFTTLAEIPDVYILGQVNSQDWAANAGTQMAYDAENQVYTATVTLDGRGESGENYFSFTTVLAENNDDGGWAYIKPYRFGAVTENYSDFWYDDMYDGQALSLCYPDEDHDPAAFRVMAGDYEMTLSLKNMTLILHKLGEEPVYLRGDVNKDGDVTISDVTALIDALLSGNLDEAEDFSPDNADANLDDSISIGDVTTIIDYLLSHNWPE